MSGFEVITGDCRETMRSMDAESIDAIVTDPPYGLSFMGKEWDKGVPGVEFWAEALRVAKPGAHLLAFGGTRMVHRMAVAIEDAGWDVRDRLSWVHDDDGPLSAFISSLNDAQLQAYLETHAPGPDLAWVYGSGFPKSLDVSKAIDLMAGANRDVVCTVTKARSESGSSALPTLGENVVYKSWAVTAPATDAAKRWHGWGTALKPAVEPIIMARKPLGSTVAACVTEHGTGAINIDGCRVGDAGGTCRDGTGDQPNDSGWENMRGHGITAINAGRWPANLIHDGTRAATAGLGEFARFFYCAKPDRTEREAGLASMAARFAPTMGNGIGGKEHDPETATPKKNTHPTVKPTALMAYLCRLITPPGGTVLDPFCGSGSTGRGAVREGFRFVGCELSDDYASIARARIAHAQLNPADTAPEPTDPDQGSLFA